MISSMFEEIKGMGKVKIKRLWNEFDSLEQIKKSSPREIMDALKVTEAIAKEIIKKSNK